MKILRTSLAFLVAGGLHLLVVGLVGLGIELVSFAVLCVVRIHEDLPLLPDTIYTEMQELC